MKRLVILFLVLNFFNFNAQTKIEGIGIFKIGQFTTKKLDSVAKSQKFSFLKCIPEDCYKIEKTAKSLIEYLPIKSINTVNYKLFIEGYSYYKLNDYLINERYKSNFIFFEFFNDKLIGIRIDEPEFEFSEDLKLKYGEGENKKIEFNSKCTFKGGNVDYKITAFNKIWIDSPRNIKLIYSISNQRDENCDEITIRSIDVYDKEIIRKLDSDGYRLQQQWYEKSLKEEKQKEKDAKSSILDDL